MKVFVTGVGGQLGYDVMNELAKRGHECVGSDIVDVEKIALPYAYEQLDITDKTAVEQVLFKHQPDAVIHCAAWTAVDAAEDEENQAKVFSINADGTKHIAEACKSWVAKCFISALTMFLTDGGWSLGLRTARTMLR